MPLSLLLASTWVTDFSAQEIAAQISHSLDFLTVEWADLPERQRSLRATFEYSWNLLNPSEQVVLMSLAVFRNPFTHPGRYSGGRCHTSAAACAGGQEPIGEHS